MSLNVCFQDIGQTRRIAAPA